MKTRNELGRFFESRGYEVAAEVGVLRGEFSDVIMSSWSGKLLMIDRWAFAVGYQDIANVSDSQHKGHKEAAEAVAARHGRGVIMHMASREAAAAVGGGSIDAVYIDADHSKASVLEDLALWLPKVRSGGVIAGHDYLDGVLPEGVFGVKSAVLEFFGREPDVVTSEAWPSWIMEVA